MFGVLVGTSAMDGAILVVAATDGTMPQTREHILLSKQVGVNHIVVFINKADMADDEMIELVEMEVRDILTQYGFDGENSPVVIGSALNCLQGTNDALGKSKVIELMKIVDEYIPTPVRDLEKPFMMPIDSTHQISGRGVVLTGKLLRGQMKAGDKCEIVGNNVHIKSQINSLELFRQTLEKGEAGDQMGLLIKGLKRGDCKRGCVVIAPGTSSVANHVKAKVYLLSTEEGGVKRPVANNSHYHVFSMTWDAPGACDIVGKDLLMPGEDGEMILKFPKMQFFENGQKFTLRISGNTIGYGVVTELLPTFDWESYLEERKDIKRAHKKAKKAAERQGH